MPKISKNGRFRKAAAAGVSLSSQQKQPVKSAPSTKLTADPDAMAVDHQKVDVSLPLSSLQTAAAVAQGEADEKTTNIATTTTSSTTTNNNKAKKISKEEAKDGLSRGQRKRLAKRDQYMNREKMILSSLRLKRNEEQKKRIDGFDAMKNALLGTLPQTVPKDDGEKKEKSTEKSKDHLKSTTTTITNKSRKLLVAKEVSQMNLVLQHPAFQADPFATMREHLQNTLACDIQQHKKEAILHLKERKDKEERKKVFKKEQGIKKKKHTKKVKATRTKSK